MNIIRGIPPKFPPNTYCSIDSEWLGLHLKTIHRPTSGKFGCLTLCIDPETVYYIDNLTEIQSALDMAQESVWLMHHAKFDITHLRRYATIPPRKKLVDTMLMERILWNGYYEKFALDDLARRYLHVHLDKSLQKSFETAEVMTPEMIEYSCKDASILRQIWDVQKTYITNDDMKIWRDVDLPALWAVLDFKGFRLDVEAWEKLADENKTKADAIIAELPFNPNSPKQVKNYLREKGFKGLEDSQENTLQSYIRKYPETDAVLLAEKTLECRTYRKYASTYGKGWVRDYLEWQTDGGWALFADYMITGAETGRMSASDPPLHQIPVRETKAFRECFIASPGNVLVIADYSAQEPFLSAYISQDEAMMEICNSGKDIYIEVAKAVFGEEITKDDPRRKQMKSLVLGTDYGMSKYGLAKRENISEDAAEALLYRFFQIFPRLASYMHEQKRNKRLVRTVMGRKIYLNPYSNQCERNALNGPIQGSASDITKMALAEIHRNLQGNSFGIVAVIHDEIVLDVPEARGQEIAELVQTIMIDVANQMCPGMKFRAETHVGKTWAEK